jgi:hypothetical protein
VIYHLSFVHSHNLIYRGKVQIFFMARLYRLMSIFLQAAVLRVWLHSRDDSRDDVSRSCNSEEKQWAWLAAG